MVPSAWSPSGIDHVCPVFVGRQDLLALASRRWESAATGHGALLLLTGEAGIGKSRLLDELASRAVGARRISAWTFPRDAELVGGLLLDLAAGLRRAGLAAEGDRMQRLLLDQSRSGDAARGRRLLALEVAEILIGVLTAERTLLALEDLHWADGLSLEVLERVATRINTTPSVAIVTYRSDELYPRTVLQAWRTRLIAQRRGEEVRLPRLDAAGTAEMVRAMTGELAPAHLIDELQDRSDGIPLHVEELLASGAEATPDSVAEAVLGRMASLDVETIRLAHAAAVIGRNFDRQLIAVVAGTGLDHVDAALDQLARHHLIEPHPDGYGFDYRHALLRDAIYSDIPASERRALHEAVAGAAVGAGLSEAFRSDHLEHAGLAAAANDAAMGAAAEAAAVSAHREAAGLYRRAQRTQPASASVRDRAELERLLAAELAAIDENSAAAELLQSAIGRLRGLEDEATAAPLVSRLMAATHLLGADYTTRAALAEESLERLGPPEPGQPSEPHAVLWAALAAAAMLDRRLDTAIEAGRRATELVPELDADELTLDIDATLGAVLVFAGRGDEGWGLMERAIDTATEAGFEAVAARAYRMLATSASVLVEYDRATTWLDAGIEYARRTERWNDAHYLSAHRGHVAWAVGEWEQAESIAQRALADGQDGITTRVTALYVLGYLALGRDELELAATRLTEAHQLGEAMGELQRLSPPRWGLAELALAADDPQNAVELCEGGFEESARVADAAYLFPYLVTGVRAHLALRDAGGATEWLERCEPLLTSRDIPGTLPAIDHARGLLELSAGRTGNARVLLESALEGWRARRRRWEELHALIDLASCASRSRRPRDAKELLELARAGAVAAGANLIRRRAEAVVAGVAPDGVGPLSAREFEVAQLIAAGATNRQIAERLVIAPKTVDAHVEHILAKLGAARRTEIAAWAVSPHSTDGPDASIR